MNILKTSTAAVALTVAGSMAFAESHVTADPAMDTDAVQTEQPMENTVESMGDTAENAGDAMTETAESAGDMQNFDLTTSENLIRTRDITGGEIWRMDAAEDNTAWTSNEAYAGTGEGWERIGSIEDVVLSKTGQMVGIVGEVGGFLGLGDKMVMMPISDVRLTALDDGSYAYVTQLTQEEIEAAQDVDEGFWE
ncbi:PRC-barrel domain-containing protein [Loktanella sp. DJP18]|uniref:PRC-barrel domain-containing protein n=1 Tax=Loktanella sp. DJP18 TaxID=3409788 RepID=UPI003BB80EC1